MARIRTIKPEFWTSEQVVECSPITRLLFIGLWNFADDQGRMVVSPKQIKMRIFPGDDDITSSSVRRMLDELSENGLILYYVVENIEYLHITGWSKHQKIDRPQASRHPAPQANSTMARRTVSERSSGEGNGREGSLREESKLQPDGASPLRVGAREEPARQQQKQKVFDHAAANELERRLRDAAGYGSSPAPGLLVTGPIQTLLDEGYDLEREILPAVAARAKSVNGTAGSWSYFVGAIRQYRETLRRASAQGTSGQAAARSVEATIAALTIPPPEQIRARRIEAYRRRGIDPDTERGRREILVDCIRAPSVEDRCDIGRIPIPAEWIRQHLMVEENAAAIMCFAPDIAITKILFDRFSDRDGSRQGLTALWEAMRARGHTADSLRDIYLSDGLALPDSGLLAAKL